MSIKILPDQVINRLKAGEVVERPASVIKELIENSLDAQANHISIDIHDGGKQLLLIQDNGTGIEYADSELILARYATSKISSDDDLDHLGSYWFRGEALASIAEVSSITLETKTNFADIGFQVTKDHQLSEIKKVTLPYYHGTKIMIRDLFANTPVRKKFLKSSQTEYFYCYQMCVDFALIRHDIHRTIKKNGNLVHDLPITNDIQSRVIQLFKKDRSQQLYSINYNQANIVINGVISDTTLTFGSNEYCKIYVNGRPVQDRALQKAIMDGYHRQIAHGEYPLAIINIDVPSDMVDVNIHPRKLQVKFIDPWAIFSSLKSCIEETLWDNKVFHGSHTSVIAKNEAIQNWNTPQPNLSIQWTKNSSTVVPFTQQNNERLLSPEENSLSFKEDVVPSRNGRPEGSALGAGLGGKTIDGTIIGQLRDSYIIVQHNTGIWYIDQHALAERIAFEKMTKEITDRTYWSSTLLHPISIQISATEDIEDIATTLNEMKFETSIWGTNTIIIYKVPDFITSYGIDIEKVMRHMIVRRESGDSWREHNEISGTKKLLDSILATRACKTSIKAWHKLSLPEMNQLVKDGFTYIPWSFVCQHGRPFCIEIEKKEIDSMFDR